MGAGAVREEFLPRIDFDGIVPQYQITQGGLDLFGRSGPPSGGVPTIDEKLLDLMTEAAYDDVDVDQYIDVNMAKYLNLHFSLDDDWNNHYKRHLKHLFAKAKSEAIDKVKQDSDLQDHAKTEEIEKIRRLPLRAEYDEALQDRNLLNRCVREPEEADLKTILSIWVEVLMRLKLADDSLSTTLLDYHYAAFYWVRELLQETYQKVQHQLRLAAPNDYPLKQSLKKKRLWLNEMRRLNKILLATHQDKLQWLIQSVLTTASLHKQFTSLKNTMVLLPGKMVTLNPDDYMPTPNWLYFISLPTYDGKSHNYEWYKRQMEELSNTDYEIPYMKQAYAGAPFLVEYERVENLFKMEYKRNLVDPHHPKLVVIQSKFLITQIVAALKASVQSGEGPSSQEPISEKQAMKEYNDKKSPDFFLKVAIRSLVNAINTLEEELAQGASLLRSIHIRRNILGLKNVWRTTLHLAAYARAQSKKSVENLQTDAQSLFADIQEHQQGTQERRKLTFAHVISPPRTQQGDFRGGEAPGARAFTPTALAEKKEGTHMAGKPTTAQVGDDLTTGKRRRRQRRRRRRSQSSSRSSSPYFPANSYGETSPYFSAASSDDEYGTVSDSSATSASAKSDTSYASARSDTSYASARSGGSFDELLGGGRRRRTQGQGKTDSFSASFPGVFSEDLDDNFANAWNTLLASIHPVEPQKVRPITCRSQFCVCADDRNCPKCALRGNGESG